MIQKKMVPVLLPMLLLVAVISGCDSSITLFNTGTGSSGTGGTLPPGTGGGTIGYEPSTCTNPFSHPSSPNSSGPVIFFSDLDWGPKTGWEGSTSKGAAVTIWGRNFGSTRGTGFVTVNGAKLASDSDYAENWGLVGPARGLERITFWVPSSASDGTGSIFVTVNGVTSNTVPFTVMSGKIYFISVSSGNNSYNGLSATAQGGSNGPFQDIKMFNPGLNPSQDNESYICYVREGTYVNQDVDSAMVALRGPYGGPTKRKALIAYPGETPLLDTTNADRGLIWNADYNPYGRNSYFTYSKLTAMNGYEAIGVLGDYVRIIGCTFKNYLLETWGGVLWVTASRYTSVHGNLFDNNGYDSYKHNIYIKTQPGASVDRATEYLSAGWNEFSKPYSNEDYGGAIFISRTSDSDDYQTRCIYIHDSYFHDGNQDFIYIGDNVDIGDIFIYNNLFKGGVSGNGAISFAGGTNKVYLHNNIFYQTGTFAGVMMAGFNTGGPLDIRVYSINNIWYNSPGADFLYWDEAGKGAVFYSYHDLFFMPGGNVVLPSGTGISVDNWFIGDPQFVATGSDFHLQPSSPAIDAGSSLADAIVKTDYDGNARPAGSAYDMGIFAY
jgi:hypothetical protein